MVEANYSSKKLFNFMSIYELAIRQYPNVGGFRDPAPAAKKAGGNIITLFIIVSIHSIEFSDHHQDNETNEKEAFGKYRHDYTRIK